MRLEEIMVVTPERPELSRRRALEVELSQLGALAEAQLSQSITAFERRDVALAEQSIADDARIDAAHRAIEIEAIAMLSEERLDPLGVREAVAAIKVAGDLERVGDLAKNVAKRTLVLSEEPKSLGVASGVAAMGRQSLLQLSNVLDAFSARNVQVARAVWGADDNIDELYNSLFNETLQAMMRDAEQVNACTHLVFISKNFERVGDHATNIAEALYMLVTGKTLTNDRPKGDETPTTFVSRPDEAPSEG
ncbi:MAG: phosphate signaling complex protein PhoU [Pseudomonadota bacterium]